MAELMKRIKASNESYESDLMKSFVAKYKGELSQSLDAGPGVHTGGISGASLFAPSSPPASSVTTSATTSTTGTDNANANILIQGSRTDNVQSTTTTTTGTQDNAVTTESNQNTINANRNTTAAATTTTTGAATTVAASPEEPDTNANMSEVAAVLAQVRGPVPENRQTLVQHITVATEKAHRETCINTHKAVNDATVRIIAEQEAGQLPDIGNLSLCAIAMWEKMMHQMTLEMGNAIKFFKMLPGFDELSLEDRMLLIKQGIFEVMMARFSMLINAEKETMMDPSHQIICSRNAVREMPMGHFLGGFFRVGAKFNPIGLTDHEIGVFTALLAFSPGRHGLKESHLVGTIQSLYQQALFNLMKSNHSDPEAKFRQALSLLPMFRGINQEHSAALMAMKSQNPALFDTAFPSLHKDIYPGEQ